MVKAEEDTSLLHAATPASPGEAMSVDIKPEPDSKSEQALTAAALDADVNDTKRDIRKMSSSTSPPLEEEDRPSPSSSSKKPSASPVPTAPAATATTNSRKAQPIAPQLIGHLPISREEALKTFVEIPCNNYQNKSIGRSKEMFESMTCDCVYEHGVDNEEDACGPYSDCINRLTQVECLSDDCRCRSYCQNQKFQKREYANIEIVLTELKGYGLRAEGSISKDTFIYEYVGDVVSPASFKKRMRDYALEGIEHFYFMMLQKDEFIDATKSGGIGRFANHSCNPNCYVAKWTVGQHVRMGIFSKRDIEKHEELTFNYNVDRYGHQAQTCYCGEPNCVGFIGGKTQTDIVTMDDLYLDALGITDEDDVAALKGTKKKKGKKIDDLDFMPKIKPIVESEVPKVVQAIRQTQSKKVLLRLLNRIKITEDQAALRQVMRLRGYSVMKLVLDEHTDELDLMEMVLQCLKTWPLLNKNKVDDSVIDASVEEVLKRHEESESLKTMGQELLDHWKSLPVYSRIPKRMYLESEKPTFDSESQIYDYAKERQKKAELRLLKQKSDEESRRRDFREFKRPRISTSVPPPKPHPLPPPTPTPATPDPSIAHKKTLKGIIANAEALAEEERKVAKAKAEAEAKAASEKAERVAKRKAKAAAAGGTKNGNGKKGMTEEERAANKEKRLLKLVGAVVVKCMSKYAKGLSKELFKKYAKELTQIIADKEKKSSSYKDDRLESLSEEKTAKIKKFSKDYIAKVLRKLEKSGKLHHHHRPHSAAARPSSHSMTPTNATASSSTHTPNSADGRGDMMSVEEAMDLDPESGSDADGDGEEDAQGEDDDAEGEDDEGEEDGDGEGDQYGIPPATPSTAIFNESPMPFSSSLTAAWRGDEKMDLDDGMGDPGWETTDPRRRMDSFMTAHG